MRRDINQLHVGAECTVNARSIANDGSCVCDLDGFVVFTRGVLPGERARVRIIDLRASYAKADLLKICEYSADRVAPACRYFGICGGCDLMHMSYTAELEYKRRLVAEAFGRIAGLKDICVKPVKGVYNRDKTDFLPRYRNKGQYKYSGNGFGFYKTGSHDFVAVDDCLLQKNHNAAILKIIAEWAAGSRSDNFIISDVSIRTSEASGEIMAIINCRSFADTDMRLIGRRGIESVFSGFPDVLKSRIPGLKSIVVNNTSFHGHADRSRAERDNADRSRTARENANSIRTDRENAYHARVTYVRAESDFAGKRSFILYGDGAINEMLGHYTFRVSHEAFFQVNTKAAGILYETIMELADIKPDENALDFYCGAGTISAYLAGAAKTVTGVDASADAIADARENTAKNKLTNLEFIKGNAEEAAYSFLRDGVRPDLIVLDPPRRGCPTPLLKSIDKLNASRIIYVSCDPATLCRDISRLTSDGGGYAVASVRPIDMFPRTANIETAVLLTRK